MAKIHWIGSGNLRGWAATACGIHAQKTNGEPDKYDTDLGRRIEAKHCEWRGVTCKACLRNIHAPGGRHHNLRADT